MSGLIGDYLLSGTGAPTDPPDLFGEWGWYQDDSTGELYTWSPIDLDWSLLGLEAVEYPKRATMWHDASLVTAGNALLRQHSTSDNYFTDSLQNTSANGDTFTHSFFVEAATYTLSVLGVTASGHGKIDWYVDNVLQGAGGQDWYSGSVVRNVVQTQSVTVIGDGYHVLKGVVNGKNASSAGYNIILTTFWLTPSAD